MEKQLTLSGSSDGAPIAVSSTEATTIHEVPVRTAITRGTLLDQPFLYASNNTETAALLTVKVGDDTAFVRSIPAREAVAICEGELALGAGKTVTAQAAAADAIVIIGLVNRIID